MITASHLPFHRNGFKFFTAEGGAEKVLRACINGTCKSASCCPETHLVAQTLLRVPHLRAVAQLTTL